jgi:hypothetical protein
VSRFADDDVAVRRDAERLCVSPFIPPSNAKDAVTRLKRSAAMM